MRTTPQHENDILPVVSVWIPSGLVAYFSVFKLTEWALLQNGYAYRMPVEICGGGACDTVQMVAAEYYAGPAGIAAMLLVWGGWSLRQMLREKEDD